MSPSLRDIEAGLREATEALAAELASGPGGAMPEWTDLQWRFASAAAAAHGVSSLLCGRAGWSHPGWRDFVAAQRSHVEQRHRRIASLLQHIDANARAAGLALVALKGAALHALGLYAPGERPMADIDLLVRPDELDTATHLLQDMGYVHSFDNWRHRVFIPANGEPPHCLGEHRDTPINIELHTRIHERLPVRSVDITARIDPCTPSPGLNPYPSNAALMSHLLLHAAGNLCNRSLRLLHLHDLALLARRMTPEDWDALLDAEEPGPPWWALPPLRLVARYYREAIPPFVLDELARTCPAVLNAVSRRQTLTRVSCSRLWVQALPGIEWSRSVAEACSYFRQRLRPSEEKLRERDHLVRTQLWLQQRTWATGPHWQRVVTGLVRRVPRLDTLYVVNAAMKV
jgi:hypothetical protein